VSEKTILVVEDEENLLETLRYRLTREGYQVIAARDGEQAIELARSGKPDLILLDIMLPKLDGLEVCRILRKQMTVPILQVYRELLTFMLKDPRTIDRATHLLWVAHNLERIADRATNIAERVIFLITGKMEEVASSKY